MTTSPNLERPSRSDSTTEQLNRLIERQIAHIRVQRNKIAQQREEIEHLKAALALCENADAVLALKAELIDTRGAWDYAEERAAEAVQTALKAGALIDQQQAHIDTLEHRTTELLAMLNESDLAIAASAEYLRGEIFANLIFEDQIVPPQFLDGEEDQDA